MAFGRSRFQKSSSTSSSDPFPLLIANWVLRFLQLVFAVAVIGLYAQDLKKAHDLKEAHDGGLYSDSKWGYAVAVAVLSAVTSLVYCVPMLKSYWAFGWDLVLFILWAAVFGIFGKMFIHENPEGDAGIKRMKDAVWIDLINMLLWFVTAVFAAVWFFFLRGGRSRFTGRAAV